MGDRCRPCNEHMLIWACKHEQRLSSVSCKRSDWNRTTSLLEWVGFMDCNYKMGKHTDWQLLRNWQLLHNYYAWSQLRRYLLMLEMLTEVTLIFQNARLNCGWTVVSLPILCLDSFIAGNWLLVFAMDLKIQQQLTVKIILLYRCN